MLDGYYDEASAVVNQILLMPTEIPAVKYALMSDLGRTSRRGLPREIGDTARRLIHDPDQLVSYHALRLLSALYDVRDWRTVLDRMESLVGGRGRSGRIFSVGRRGILAEHHPRYEPDVVAWIKSLGGDYGTDHMAIRATQSWVRRNLDTALEVGLINKREYRDLKGAVATPAVWPRS